MSNLSAAGLRKADQRLLDRHVAALVEQHPWLRLERRQAGSVRLAGGLPMGLPDGRTESVGIAVELEARGGRIVPVAFDRDERWPADPARHVVTDRQFCLS